MEKVNLSRATTISDVQLKDVMEYHKWTDAQTAVGNLIRNSLGIALKVIIENVPPSADRSAAIRKLRDARMDCNSAITHDGAY